MNIIGSTHRIVLRTYAVGVVLLTLSNAAWSEPPLINVQVNQMFLGPFTTNSSVSRHWLRTRPIR